MSCNFTKRILALSSLYLLLSPAAPAAAQVRVVGEAAWPQTDMRINDNGAVVGGSLNGQVLIFEKNAYQALPALLVPQDINNSNEVAGTQLVFRGAGPLSRPANTLFRVDASSLVQRLYSSIGSAARISEVGDVSAGAVVILDPMDPYCMRGGDLSIFCPVAPVPALFPNTGGVFTFRESLGDEFIGGVSGLNSSGDIAGTRSLDVYPNTQAFRKRHDAAVELLPTLGGASAEALAMNDRAVVVGQAQDAAGTLRAFRFDSAISDLGTLGGSASKAQGINNLGHIVGTSQNAAGENRAFLFKAGAMTDLNSFVPPTRNLTLISATDINEFQEISGVAQRVGTSQYVGYRFSFVETTVAAATSCRRVAGDRTILRRNQQCRFSGTLTNFRGRRLPNRTVLFQYAAQKAGPWVGLALARTDRLGQYRKSLSLRNAGYYRALGPISDATLPMVPSGQIQAR